MDFDRLKIPSSRLRASFRDFNRAIHQEHPTVTTEWQLLDGGRWRATLTCRECGSFTMTLSDADMTTLNERAPGFLPNEFRDEDGDVWTLDEMREKLAAIREYWRQRRDGAGDAA